MQVWVAIKEVARMIDHVSVNMGLDGFLHRNVIYFLVLLMTLIPIVLFCIIVVCWSDPADDFDLAP